MDNAQANPIKKAAMASLALGAWQLASTFSFTLSSERMRSWDGLSALVFLLLGILGLGVVSNRAQSWIHSLPWLVALVGLCNLVAPLLFWASDAICYLNGTLVGVVAIFFSMILPVYESDQTPGDHRPDGWSFNPSSWTRRQVTLALCFLCWMISRYMACYQLGYLDHIWDPFFKDGTLKVITSDLSKSFPISDAGLGALVYTLEFLLGTCGGPSRWYRRPWMVMLFALMVVPAGCVSLLLIMSQPLLVGAWCGWCLLTAFFMLGMIAFTIDEMLAVLQLLFACKSQKERWATFWMGLDRAPRKLAPEAPSQPATFTQGVSCPWNLLLSALIGFTFMFLPDLFSLTGKEAGLLHILGALITSASIIAMNELARMLRYFNGMAALVLIASLLLSSPLTAASTLLALALAGALGLLSLPKGKIHERYGAYDRFIQ